jgi:hypothetical protein
VRRMSSSEVPWGRKLAIVPAEGGTVARTKLFAAVTAAALVLTAGASSAAGYSPEHPNTTAVENCLANVAKQFDKGLSGGNGAKSDPPGPFAPTNCNKFFEAPGQT